MTGGQKAGVLLIVLGLLYALFYVGWLRLSRNGPPAAGMVSGPPATEPATGPTAGSERRAAARPPGALTLAWVEGTYIGTTTAISRHERVAAAGVAVRARANMVVNDSSVRWERDGTGDIRVAGGRLLGVNLGRDPAGKFMSRTRIVLVSWQAEGGDRQATAFLPRKRDDSAVLVSAVQRLMKIDASSREVDQDGGSIQDAPAQPEPGPQRQVKAAKTQDETP
jgi:hypothetical protein